jgi:hypothetical protein
MSHYYFITDTLTGDLLDALPFCSDYCHYWYCHQNGLEYEGWNGCHEHPYDDECRECGTLIKGLEQAVAC